MTLRRRIALSAKWDSYSTAKKAEILWHELVHIRQRKKWGHAKFLARYITAEGRTMIETPAYRESIRAKKAIGKGYTRSQVEKYLDAKAKSMRSSYKLGRLDKEHYYSLVQKAWGKELP